MLTADDLVDGFRQAGVPVVDGAVSQLAVLVPGLWEMPREALPGAIRDLLGKAEYAHFVRAAQQPAQQQPQGPAPGSVEFHREAIHRAHGGANPSGWSHQANTSNFRSPPAPGHPAFTAQPTTSMPPGQPQAPNAAVAQLMSWLQNRVAASKTPLGRPTK